ncbi:MAG: dTDP-4-dehydrorhamnose reductase [Thermodesulfobacteriota bacterium]|nr:dTDP-4-dehydrorhamnose reductase [Thermodesulfobacteriota bacterium]
MKILVAGYKGMLGSDLMTTLGEVHEVTGKDIEDFNIVSASDCRHVVEKSGADVVINAAAYTNVDGCETDEARCFSVNGEGVKNLALACTKSGIKLIHFSTDYVFDGTKGTPYTENDPCNPLNIYGKSKLKGEEYLREFSDNYILLRTSWLYGKNGRNFVSAIVEKAKETGELEVVDDQTGSPTCTVDLALAVRVLVGGDYRGVFHVTNRGTCSWYQFALKILEYGEMNDVRIIPTKSTALGQGAPRPEYSVLSCQKFAYTTHRTMQFWQIALKNYMSRKS